MFVQGWGKALAGRVTVGVYDGLLAGGELPQGGAYVFSDLDRLTPQERSVLAPVHERLAREAGPARVLYDPTRSLLRYELLRELHSRGINRFKVVGPGESPSRYPVFLRPAAGFLNVAPELLHAGGSPVPGEIAVEFCDTADTEGIYRKYGAFVVGERIVPRHLFFSRRWMVKTEDLLEERFLAEELEYLAANPHAAALQEVCRLAHLRWGRIDYSLLDGQVQVWEINTNPIFASPGPAKASPRDAVHRLAAKNLVDALLALA